MNFEIRKGNLTTQTADLLVVNEFEGFLEPGGATGAVDRALGGYISEVMKEEGFRGKLGETLMVRTEEVIPAKRVLLVGLGKKEDFCEEQIREVSAVSYNFAKKIGAKNVVSILHGAGAGNVPAKICAKAMVEGVNLAAYKFDSFKKKKIKSKVQNFSVVSKNGNHVRQAKTGIVSGEINALGTIFARDLVNTPAGHMKPVDLVNVAREIKRESKGLIKLKVFDKEKLGRMGANAFLGVAQGSDEEPYMVHMKYVPDGAKKKIAIVGKAVTFDSGGLSLKPSSAMTTMKIDMAGAAAVLAVFSVLTKLQPKVEVEGIFAACENMPSGKAIRPGDIVKSLNGKTIEIIDTDAEGRVTLADSLSYAVRQRPDMLIDLATLTGACMVALGEEITGVMCNNSALENKIMSAAVAAGEKMWSLPLEKNYKKSLKSDFADLKNLGGRYGGATTAGLFLQEFVGHTPWAHLDIAGPSYAEKPLNSYTKKGASGVGVRTLLEFLRSV